MWDIAIFRNPEPKHVDFVEAGLCRICGRNSVIFPPPLAYLKVQRNHRPQLATSGIACSRLNLLPLPLYFLFSFLLYTIHTHYTQVGIRNLLLIYYSFLFMFSSRFYFIGTTHSISRFESVLLVLFQWDWSGLPTFCVTYFFLVPNFFENRWRH
jgi:hypothetical protein